MDTNQIVSTIAVLIAVLSGGFLLGVPIMKAYYRQKMDLESTSSEEKTYLSSKISKLKEKIKKTKRK
jgi:hypothetical protein